MARFACPVCGDPNAYLFWVDREPPEGCPDDMDWQIGKPRSIRNVTECKFQLAKAWQAAEFRKVLPEAFDETGAMRPGRLADVLSKFAEKWPGKAITL